MNEHAEPEEQWVESLPEKWETYAKKHPNEAARVKEIIANHISSKPDTFTAWWFTQGCRLEAVTQEEFARKVWEAAELRCQPAKQNPLLEGVL